MLSLETIAGTATIESAVAGLRYGKLMIREYALPGGATAIMAMQGLGF